MPRRGRYNNRNYSRSRHQSSAIKTSYSSADLLEILAEDPCRFPVSLVYDNDDFDLWCSSLASQLFVHPAFPDGVTIHFRQDRFNHADIVTLFKTSFALVNFNSEEIEELKRLLGLEQNNSEAMKDLIIKIQSIADQDDHYSRVLFTAAEVALLKTFYDKHNRCDFAAKLISDGAFRWPMNLKLIFDGQLSDETVQFFSDGYERHVFPAGFYIELKNHKSDAVLLQRLIELRDQHEIGSFITKMKWRSITWYATSSMNAFKKLGLPDELSSIIFSFLVSAQANHISRKALPCYLMAIGYLRPMLDPVLRVERDKQDSLQGLLCEAEKTALQRYDARFMSQVELLREEKGTRRDLEAQLLKTYAGDLRRFMRERRNDEHVLSVAERSRFKYANQLSLSAALRNQPASMDAVQSKASAMVNEALRFI